MDIPWGKGIKCSQTIQIGLPYIIDPEKPPRVILGEKSYIIHGFIDPSLARKNQLFAKITVDKLITYSGDTVFLDVLLDNNSGRKIQSIRVKLKQIWHFGGNVEKVDIFRLTHKDKQFPLGNASWRKKIPIIVPNTDFRPTITNATLIFVVYLISFRAVVHFGTDLTLKIPILMASFPPLIKTPNGYEQIVDAISSHRNQINVLPPSSRTQQEIRSELQIQSPYLLSNSSSQTKLETSSQLIQSEILELEKLANLNDPVIFVRSFSSVKILIDIIYLNS